MKKQEDSVWNLLLVSPCPEAPGRLLPNILRDVRLLGEQSHEEFSFATLLFRWLMPAAAAACLSYFCLSAAISEYRTEQEVEFYMAFADAMEFEQLVMLE